MFFRKQGKSEKGWKCTIASGAMDAPVHTCISTYRLAYMHICTHTYMLIYLHTCKQSTLTYMHTYLHTYNQSYMHAYTREEMSDEMLRACADTTESIWSV